MESSLSAETWKGKKKNMASKQRRSTTIIWFSCLSLLQCVCYFPSFLTSENLPSPNHCSHLMPWLACRLPVARHVTTMPGHQEKPLIFPHTSSPMPKPLLSWMEEAEEGEDKATVFMIYILSLSRGTQKVWGVEKRIAGRKRLLIQESSYCLTFLGNLSLMLQVRRENRTRLGEKRKAEERKNEAWTERESDINGLTEICNDICMRQKQKNPYSSYKTQKIEERKEWRKWRKKDGKWKQ